MLQLHAGWVVVVVTYQKNISADSYIRWFRKIVLKSTRSTYFVDLQKSRNRIQRRFFLNQMNFLVDIILFHARICIICNCKDVWFLLTNTLVGVFVFLVRFEELKEFIWFLIRFKNKPNLKPVLLSDYLTKGGMLWVQYQAISGNHIKHVRSGFHLRSWIFMKSFDKI